jgi:hypothetical protein
LTVLEDQAYRTAVRRALRDAGEQVQERLEGRSDALTGDSAVEEAEQLLENLKADGEQIVSRLDQEFDTAPRQELQWTALSVLANRYAQHLLVQAPEHRALAHRFARYITDLYDRVDRQLANSLDTQPDAVPLAPVFPRQLHTDAIPFDRVLAPVEDAPGASDTALDSAYYEAFYYATQQQPDQSYSRRVAAAWAATHGQHVLSPPSPAVDQDDRAERGEPTADETPSRGQPVQPVRGQPSGRQGVTLGAERALNMVRPSFERAVMASGAQQKEQYLARGFLLWYRYLDELLLARVESYALDRELMLGPELSASVRELQRLAAFEQSVFLTEERLAAIWLDRDQARGTERREEIVSRVTMRSERRIEEIQETIGGIRAAVYGDRILDSLEAETVQRSNRSGYAAPGIPDAAGGSSSAARGTGSRILGRITAKIDRAVSAGYLSDDVAVALRTMARRLSAGDNDGGSTRNGTGTSGPQDSDEEGGASVE